MSGVTDAIDAATSDQHLRLSMRIATAIECKGDFSGSCPGNGANYGPFSINTIGTGITAGQASDPTQAVAIMLPKFQSCAASQNWGDPLSAAWATAGCAERPNGSASYNLPSSTEQSIYNNALANMGGGAGNVSVPVVSGLCANGVIGRFIPPGVCGIVNAGASAANAAASGQNPLSAAFGSILNGDNAVRLLIGLGGIVLIIFGLAAIVRGETASAAPALAPAALAAAA